MNATVGPLIPRRKTIILMSCCLSLLIVSMDATIVNVAIPAIRLELGASAAQLQWVIDIYTLVLASLLMLSGATGDRFGRRRVFQIGLSVFAIGSLLCSLAPDVHRLIAARFLQGIGGSMLNPVALSIISQVPSKDPRPHRGRWRSSLGGDRCTISAKEGLTIVEWVYPRVGAGRDPVHRRSRRTAAAGWPVQKAGVAKPYRIGDQG